MKKYLPYAHLIAAGSGILALLLRILALNQGADATGLYPDHFAWPLVCVLALLMTALFWLLSRQTEPKRSYRDNFPSSMPGAIGCAAAALGFAAHSLRLLGGDLLDLLCGILGFLGAVGLAYTGYLRLKGKKPHFAPYAVLTLFFGLRLFGMGKVLGAEPETHLYLFRFLATVAMLVASYQLWGFTVKEGNRQKSLFWSLTAAFLCLAAVPGTDDAIFYLDCSLWLLTNLCSLTPERRARREAHGEPAAQAEAPAQAPEAQAPANPDQLIEQMLKELERK